MARSRVKATFKPDHQAFTRFATSEQIMKPLREAAHDIQQNAQTLATKRTGNYASGFKVDFSKSIVLIGAYPRAVAVVRNDDPAAAPNEFGNRHNKAKHTLARAGAMVGDFRGVISDD
jgi:hypothetical protein